MCIMVMSCRGDYPEHERPPQPSKVKQLQGYYWHHVCVIPSTLVYSIETRHFSAFYYMINSSTFSKTRKLVPSHT